MTAVAAWGTAAFGGGFTAVVAMILAADRRRSRYQGRHRASF